MNSIHALRSDKRGFTIVELLASAVILSIAVIAIIAILRMGRELQVVDNHRRQARALIHYRMENDFDYRRFKTVPGAATLDTVTLDPRQGNPLLATIGTSVADTLIYALTITGGGPVPARRIKVTVFWRESDGSEESVTLTKLLANAL